MMSFPALVAACLLAPLALASIESLNLGQMLGRSDSAVLGAVTHKATWSGPLEGFGEDPEFTTITVAGEELRTGKSVTREVTYLGSDAKPVSEMPAESETRVGTRVLVFSKTVGSWGGREGQSSMVAAQGGVFRVETGPKGDVVLGKGEGYAVEQNARASDLRESIRKGGK
jgi:hypothetical protein